jgi:hypothetical protein
MSRGLRLAPALASLLVLACPEPAAPPAPPATPAGRLVELSGRVTLERDGGLAPEGPGPLYPGDVVETGPAARALLEDGRGRRLELGEETRFRIDRTLQVIAVDVGDITFLDDEDGGSAWAGATLRTPFGSAVLSAGGAARVRLSDAGLTAEVRGGELRLDDVEGGTSRAGRGQRLVVGVGEIEFDEVDAGLTPRRLRLRVGVGEIEFDEVDAGAARPGLKVGVGEIEFDEPPPPAVVTLKVAAGKAQVKAAGAPRFAAVTKEAPLESGAAFQVPPGAKARLEGAGFSLAAPAGSGGQVDAVTRKKDASEVSLSKVRGALSLTLDGSTPAQVLIDGVALSGRRPATVQLGFSGKQASVEVRAGELIVTRDGVERTVRAGEALAVGPGPLGEPQALRALVTVPIGRAGRVFGERLGFIGLGLPDDAPHRVQVSTEPEFRAPFIDGAATRQVVVPAPARGELFWRTLDGDAAAAQGRVRFGPDTSSQGDGQAKSDTVAETGLKATIYFQRAPPALTFTFAPTAGAASYQVRVLRAGDPPTPLLERQVREPRAVFQAGQLGEGRYLWYAAPLDAAGNELVGGRMNQLDVVYDNSLTALLIASPRDGERAGPGTVASGVAPLDGSLSINGRPVRADQQGRFSVPVPREDVLVFHLRRGASDSFWVRRLRR